LAKLPINIFSGWLLNTYCPQPVGPDSLGLCRGAPIFAWIAGVAVITPVILGVLYIAGVFEQKDSLKDLPIAK
jgi:hypothetical protein